MNVNSDSLSSIGLGDNTLIIGSNNASISVADQITGTGNITKIGTGTYNFTGASTSGSWSTTISEGSITITAPNNLGAGTLFFEPTTTGSTVGSLESTSPIDLAISNPIQISSGFTAIFDAPNELDLNGPITTSGGNVTIQGLITFGNSGGNTYSGITTVPSGSSLVLNRSNVSSPFSHVRLLGLRAIATAKSSLLNEMKMNSGR